MADKIQSVDPDSAEFTNPLGPKDPTGLVQQALQTKLPDMRRPMVPKPGYYPERQG